MSYSDMNIHSVDKVLEIGSGGNPDKRSTILCDKFLSNNSQRGEQRIVIDRPFVVADGDHLPFKNKSFDYVICKHILEHIDDPMQFASELARVSHRGYIESPSIVWEKMQPFRKHHKWVIFAIDSNLVLKRNDFYDPVFSELIKNIIIGSKSIAILKKSYKNILNVHFEWEDKINLIVEPPNYEILLDEWISASIKLIKNDLAHETTYHSDKSYFTFLRNVLKFRRPHKLFLGTIINILKQFRIKE